MDFVQLTSPKNTPGSIRNWVNSNSVEAAEIVADAEDWLAHRLRVQGMIHRENLVLAQGASELPIGGGALARYLDPIELWNRTDNCAIESLPEWEIDRKRSYGSTGALETGAPEAYSQIGEPGEDSGKLLFDMVADREYALTLTFNARPVALSADNKSNLYTRKYPVLFRHVCLGMSYIFLKDEGRANAVLGIAGNILSSVEEMADLARRGQRFDARTYG